MTALYKLYLFDLDGTLINSLEDLADAADWMLTQSGFPGHTLEEYRRFVGNGVYKLVERALPEDCRDPKEVTAFKAVFDARYRAHCMDKTRPYPGVLELLDRLRSQGAELAVLSNKSDEFVQEIVGGIFGPGTFRAVRGQREGVAKKPAPDGVWSLLEELSVYREDALFIGDSDVDVLTAKNAGLPCAGAVWGFRGREELAAAGAEFLVEAPLEILDLPETH